MPRYTDIALGAGAVLAVGLGLLALQPDRLETEDGPGADTVRTTATATATASPSDEPTKSPAPDKTSEAAAPLPAAWAVGAGDGLVVRAPQGDCTSAGPVTITSVGARGKATAASVERLAAVGGIEVQDDLNARLVGVDDGCERVGFGTSDGGKTWKALETVPAIWSVVPGSTTEVHAPSGQVEVPCEPLSVTGLDANVARLACTGGQIMGTVSGGDDWAILGNNDDVLAVGFVSATTAMALVEHEDCAGVSVDRSTDGGTDFEPSYCVEGTGPWGLVTGGDTVVVVGKDVVARSDDDGETWDTTPLRS